MLVLGDKDIEDGVVSVRSRKDGDLGSRSVEDFIADLLEEIETKRRFKVNGQMLKHYRGDNLTKRIVSEELIDV